MPSLTSKYLSIEMRILRPLLNKFNINRARILQDLFGDIRKKIISKKVDYTEITLGCCEACFVVSKDIKKNNKRVILYLHGGSYVFGGIKYARGFAGTLAMETKQRVFTIAYRLAPENPYPAAVEDSFSAYEYLLREGYSPGNVALVGESAGGGLIFSLCLLLKQKGVPLPSALIGISPWADLTFSGESYKYNRKKDPVLSEEGLRKNAAAYAKDHERDPLVSPIYGDLSKFPPVLIIVGGNELLLDDSKRLAESLLKQGNKCELIIEEGLWHVYVLFKTPEAKVALGKIAAFLR